MLYSERFLRMSPIRVGCDHFAVIRNAIKTSSLVEIGAAVFDQTRAIKCIENFGRLSEHL